jgi:hypothetical protein
MFHCNYSNPRPASRVEVRARVPVPATYSITQPEIPESNERAQGNEYRQISRLIFRKLQSDIEVKRKHEGERAYVG